MRNDNVKPDWWCVAIDETRHWNIDEADKPFIERIVGIYFYDAREYTYCCEITPSHHLRYVQDSIFFKSDTPDEKRDELINKYETYNGEDCYMHVSTVKGIGDEWKRHFGEVDDPHVERDEQEDYVREYYQGNCPF